MQFRRTNAAATGSEGEVEMGLAGQPGAGHGGDGLARGRSGQAEDSPSTWAAHHVGSHGCQLMGDSDKGGNTGETSGGPGGS